MFVKMIKFYYNNFKTNTKFLIRLFGALLLCICVLPWIWVFKGFYDIRVSLATVNVRIHFIGRRPKIIRRHFYSSPLFSPIRTAIWYIVATNKDLQSAKQKGFEDEIIEVTKKMLARYRYPKKAIHEVHIGIVSMEAIDASGGFLNYFS